MTNHGTYSPEILELLSDPEARLVWEREGLLGAFALAVEDAMREKGYSRAQLARAVGVSPQAVSRALGSGQNLTVTTMLQIAMAFGNTLKVKMVPLENLARFSNQPVKSDVLDGIYTANSRTESPYVGVPKVEWTQEPFL
jgi:transcriptional regulator with XRE-family HTH domain